MYINLMYCEEGIWESVVSFKFHLKRWRLIRFLLKEMYYRLRGENYFDGFYFSRKPEDCYCLITTLAPLFD